MIREWRKVYDQHKLNPPNWQHFRKEYRKGIAAPDNLPTPEQLFARAQRAKDSTSGGADGWRPRELKTLPLEAWEYRAVLVKLYM